MIDAVIPGDRLRDEIAKRFARAAGEATHAGPQEAPRSPRLMRRLWRAYVSAGLAFLAASGGALSFARADLPLNARFVEMFSRTGQKRHPLADASGKLPVVVQLPIGKTAREAGFQPFAPGLGVVKVSPAALGAFEAAHPGLGYSIGPPFMRCSIGPRP